MKALFSFPVLSYLPISKWFCYVNIEVFDRCCLKSKPDIALELRARYNGIRPAWHMNKRHWNDVYFNQDVPDAMIRELVCESYRLVLASLPKKEREVFQGQVMLG